MLEPFIEIKTSIRWSNIDHSWFLQDWYGDVVYHYAYILHQSSCLTHTFFWFGFMWHKHGDFPALLVQEDLRCTSMHNISSTSISTWVEQFSSIYCLTLKSTMARSNSNNRTKPRSGGVDEFALNLLNELAHLVFWICPLSVLVMSRCNFEVDW